MGLKRGEINSTEIAKVFHSHVIRHIIRVAVCLISERNKGRVYLPHEADENSGDLVIDVLHGKNPNQRAVDLEDVPIYVEQDHVLDINVDRCQR